MDVGTTNAVVGAAPPKEEAPATFNAGFGNVGSWNFGSGNQGDWNFGNGNLGSGNVGSGNLGGKNVGLGNLGSGNWGGGNTGNGNIGFGNTGNNNIGIGLTGDNQFGFGGLNSGVGNTGLFNSGVGNTGIFNSGTGNWGIGNSGNRNTGSFNSGNTNTGDANVGSLNTGSFNVGSSNSGNFNTGSTNSGDFNSGDLNTGSLNSGDANTGLFNSGYLNTGIGNSGNASNGFFETEDNQNWFPGIHIGYTIPGFTIDRTVPIDIGTQIPVGPLTLTVGPTTADVHVYGSTGPIELTVLDIAAGPGFFNTGTIASSGFFNTGAGGGSGLLNTGAGLVSGFFNLAVLAGAGLGLSGYSNSGSGSGFSNLGSALSGWRNTSSLSLTDPAYLSGVENFGDSLAGMYLNGVTGGSTFNLGAGNVGAGNFGDGNEGDGNLGAGNLGNGNVGFGNTGTGNLGSGNGGNKNFGGGNDGSENVGFGNLGSKNWGSGNNGGGNIGGGNTGIGNIGFGNTGTGNFGIGLTGDNQFGIGGLNSGTGNTGLFNSGTGNTGLFNSGTNNWGFGNAGRTNTGMFNSGAVNSGFGNVGDLNTGAQNVGISNTGNANVGNGSTGVANIGNRNTGWSNTGDANTGWVNTGDFNTGAWNTEYGSNGLFWRRDNGGQLNIDLGADISKVPITLNAEIPVNVPITAELTDPLAIPGLQVPATAIPANISTTIELIPGVNANVDLAALATLGPITFPGTNIDVPQIVGTLGGPDVSIPITATGSIGPGKISLLKFVGPGLFNQTSNPSSGLLNWGAGGGSGFQNSGAGVSGLMNEALQAGLSGVSNTGSGSGYSNVGSAISGRSNTSSLEPDVEAFVSGLRNFGTNLSGLFVNAGDAPTPPPAPKPTGRVGINLNAEISEIPIVLDGNIGVNVPFSANLQGPITIEGFTLPTIPGNVNGTLSLTVPGLLGPAVIPLDPNIGIGPITVPDINVVSTDPILSGSIGGPGVSIPIHITGAIGPSAAPLFDKPLFSWSQAGTGLGADVNINFQNTPIKLNADIPVDVPVNAEFGDLTVEGFTIGGFNIATSNWATLRNQPTPSPVAGTVYLDFNVPSTDLPVGDITVDPITVDLPTLTGNIGGPGAGLGLNLNGGLGPFKIFAPIDLATDPLGVNLGNVSVSPIPLTASLTVPVGVPVTLDATPIRTTPITIQQFKVGTDPVGNALQGLVFQGAIKGTQTPPRAGQFTTCLLACLGFQLSPVVNAGPISLGPVEVGFPDNRALTLNLGGPGAGVTGDATAGLGPIVISLADNVIQEFPYSYLVDLGTDIPIEGSTGDLALQQTQVNAALQAVLYQRVAYCAALGLTCTGTTASQLIAYFNGGTPAGSAPGPFPPTPVTSSTFDAPLSLSLGPLTILPSIPISGGLTNDTAISGSGTLGPFPLSA